MFSELFHLKLNDVWKGFIVAVLTAPLTIIYDTVNSGSLKFDWRKLVCVALAGAIGYLLKNFFTGSGGKFLSNAVAQAKGMIVFMVCASLLTLTGCATPWQNKATSGWITATNLVIVSEQTVAPSCTIVPPAFSVDKCTQLGNIYGNIRQGCIVSGNTLKLAYYIQDPKQLSSTLATFQGKLTEIQALVQQYIDLYQSLVRSGKQENLKGMISPGLLQIIIQGFVALMNQLPSIISGIGTWGQSTVDIAALSAQVDAQILKLPTWPK